MRDLVRIAKQSNPLKANFVNVMLTQKETIWLLCMNTLTEQ